MKVNVNRSRASEPPTAGFRDVIQDAYGNWIVGFLVG